MAICKTEAPPPRDIGQETSETLQAYARFLPQQYQLEEEYRPRFAQLEADIARDIGPQMLDALGQLTPQATRIETDANTQRREADLADVERLGGRANEAFRAANPQLAELLDAAQDDTETGPTRLSEALEALAFEELQAGRSLTGRQRRDTEQASRAAFSARGLAMSNPAAVDEITALNDAGDRRLRERLALASAVDQMQFGQEQANRANRLNVANMMQRTGSDPFQAILGRPGQSLALASNQQAGAGNLAASQRGMVNPFNAYASDLYNTNYNAEAAARIASSNNMGAIIGGGLGAIPSLIDVFMPNGG